MLTLTKSPRRDPAPSLLRYRLTRIWLRQGVRRTVNFGLPLAVGLLGAWTVFSEYDLRGQAVDALGLARSVVFERPEFVVSEISVPDVSEELAEQIRVAAFVGLPASSLEINAAGVRMRVESLDAVERARVRVLARGALEIRAIERIPVVVWRADGHVQLLDHNGVRVAEVDSRLRRSDLPLIAGAGAEASVPEALRLFGELSQIDDRVRGLVRVGERRWDLILDRDQIVRLPENNPSEALERVMVLHAGEEILSRDVQIVDLRDPRRPILRLTDHAIAEIERLKATDPSGEDA